MNNATLHRLRVTLEDQYINGFIQVVNQQNREYFWRRAIDLMRKAESD